MKKCDQKDCQAHFHYSYYTRYHVYYDKNKLAKFYYDDSLNKEYFLSSSSTAFKTDFLRSFYSDMFLCPEYFFFQKSMNFNINWKRHDGAQTIYRGVFSTCFNGYVATLQSWTTLDSIPWLGSQYKWSSSSLEKIFPASLLETPLWYTWPIAK